MADSIGVILVANGEVFLRSESGVRQVEAGAEVYTGDELVTGTGSNAEIRFSDDTLLSQGADSSIALDDYVFDSDGGTASELLFKMGQGTFRMVTGKIAEQNPDRFHLGTPLATIGIRGTTTVHQISPGGDEKHGVEEIHSGKALLIQSIDGQVRLIDSPQALVDIAASGLMSTVRPMTVQEYDTFREIAPQAIQQEQEIQDQIQDDQQDDQQNDQPVDNQNDDNQADQQGDDAEGQNQDPGQQAGGEGDQPGEGPEGGETGGFQIAGEGVLEAGVSAFTEGELQGGHEDMSPLQQAINDRVQGLAEDVFKALEHGDVDTAQELLGKLEQVPEDDDILDLIGNTGGDTEVPENLEDQTVTTGDGTNWIYGTTGDDIWTGTTGPDNYDGLAGNDSISGNEGTDSLKGSAGNDTINGDCDNDWVDGGSGNDVVDGGHGDDTLYGGDGYDVLSYGLTSYSQPVFVDLSHGYGSMFVSHTESDYDVVSGFEGVVGTVHNDDLRGDSGNNTLQGSTGADALAGGGGDDTFYYNLCSSCEGGDTVTDFNASGSGDSDKFKFNSENFNPTEPFRSMAVYDGSHGQDAGAQFIYDEGDQQLYYDPDGSGNTAGILIANLTGTSSAVTAGDIELI